MYSLAMTSSESVLAITRLPRSLYVDWRLNVYTQPRSLSKDVLMRSQEAATAATLSTRISDVLLRTWMDRTGFSGQ